MTLSALPPCRARPTRRRRRADTRSRLRRHPDPQRPAVGALRRHPAPTSRSSSATTATAGSRRRRATTSTTSTTPPRRRTAGEHYAAMPHKSAASRNIGHYIAWKEGFDVIIALDYDCRTRAGLARGPPRQPRPGRRGPGRRSRWPTTAGSTRSRQTFDNGDTVYARGYPYEWRTPELARDPTEPVAGRGRAQHGRLGRHPRPQRHRQAVRRRARRPGRAAGPDPDRPRQHPDLRHEHRVRRASSRRPTTSCPTSGSTAGSSAATTTSGAATSSSG